MMRNFILRITALFAFVAMFASCETRKWEEVPVEYKNVYEITFAETTTNDILESVFQYHLYYDEAPYALLTYSSVTLISSVTEIIDFKDSSGYTYEEDSDTGEIVETFVYDFSFTEIVRETTGDYYRYYTANGEFTAHTETYPVTLTIKEKDVTVVMAARLDSLVRPYEDGFIGYDEPETEE